MLIPPDIAEKIQKERERQRQPEPLQPRLPVPEIDRPNPEHTERKKPSMLIIDLH